MVQAIPLERFPKIWKCSDIFLFSHSNRNDRKISYDLSKSCSARAGPGYFYILYKLVVNKLGLKYEL